MRRVLQSSTQHDPKNHQWIRTDANVAGTGQADHFHLLRSGQRHAWGVHDCMALGQPGDTCCIDLLACNVFTTSGFGCFGAWLSTSYLGRRVLLLQCWSCCKFWITHTDSLSYTRNYINTIHPQSECPTQTRKWIWDLRKIGQNSCSVLAFHHAQILHTLLVGGNGEKGRLPQICVVEDQNNPHHHIRLCIALRYSATGKSAKCTLMLSVIKDSK